MSFLNAVEDAPSLHLLRARTITSTPMSSSSPFSLLLLLFFFAHCLLPDVASYPFATIAIARDSNVTLVCALVPSGRSLDKRYDLNCTSIPGGRQETYHSRDGPYSAIAAGDGFLCGLTVPANGSSNATMRWWEFGGSEHKPKMVYFGEPITALESGDTHVCGLIGGGRELRCWWWSELGVPACGNLSEIAVGRDFLCGLLDGGAIRCFGGDKAVVGNEPAGYFTMISAGTGHACGVSADGKLCCWGVGAPGPDEIPLSSVAAMALGENKTCLLRSNGTVFCLGEGAAPPGHLADKEFLSIEAKGDLICGITSFDFSVVCWGNELLQGNNMVYSTALPGSCAPTTSCSCDVLPGSKNMCPAGEGICLSCKFQFNPNSIPLPLPLPSPSSNTSSTTTGKGRLLAVVLGPVGGGILLLALIITIFFTVGMKRESSSIYNRIRWRPQDTDSARRAELASSSQLSSSGIKEFPLRMLLKATENFSDAQKVGSGGFGTVYRATLPDDGEVAIKRAHLSVAASSSSLRFDHQMRRDRDLQLALASEIAVLSRINHKNLVRLLGFCQESGERILVYEYMSNGTLHDHLHKHTIDPSTRLGSWTERLRLALNAARGIEYLHIYAVPAIIHRDIKSSNILLDHEWTAKVSDFGVSLTSGPGEEAGTGAAGTVGYMDPEYYLLRRLTPKSDVYSFGVVLLELLTGCKAIYREDGEDGSGSGGQAEGGDGKWSSPTPKNLVEMAVPCIEADNFEKVRDRRLAPPTGEEEEAVDFVAYLAMGCVKSEARERPTMVDVVWDLERAVKVCDEGAGRDDASRVGSMRSGFLERSGFLDRSGLLSNPMGSASGSGWLVRRDLKAEG